MIRALCLIAGLITAGNAATVYRLLVWARSEEEAQRLAQAEDAYNAALELAIEKERKHLPVAAVEQSAFFLRQKEPDKAEMVLKRALTAGNAAGNQPAFEIPILMQLQSLYGTQQSNIDLMPVQTQLARAWESVAGPNSAVVANSLYRLSGTLEDSRHLAEAKKAIQRAIAILEKRYGSNGQPVGLALLRLASIEDKLGKDDLAQRALARESAIRPKPVNVFRTGGDVTAPRLSSREEPKYSEKARRKKIEGTAILSLIVETDGQPSDISVLLPLGEGLDEKAAEAVKTWRFQPGMKDGKPVRVQANVEVAFRLL